MNSGASFDYPLRAGRPDDAGSVVWALVIAFVFAAVATISFAVDQNVTLSSPAPPPVAAGQ